MEIKADLDKMNPKRVNKIEAAYIGHFGDNIVMKKLTEIKLGN